MAWLDLTNRVQGGSTQLRREVERVRAAWDSGLGFTSSENGLRPLRYSLADLRDVLDAVRPSIEAADRSRLAWALEAAELYSQAEDMLMTLVSAVETACETSERRWQTRLSGTTRQLVDALEALASTLEAQPEPDLSAARVTARPVFKRLGRPN